MLISIAEPIPIRTREDLLHVRKAVRDLATALKFNIVKQTKVVTAASELARNALIHGGGGRMTMTELADPAGMKLLFEDSGPGIADLDLAMKDGFTTGTGMGMGLGGARRLVNEFEIRSSPGHGT